MIKQRCADRYGLLISTRSQRALEHYDEGIERTLAYGVRPAEAFERAVSEDPDFALAHAALGLARMRELRLAEARACGERAVTLATGLPRRERQHVAAIAEQTSGRGAKGLALMLEHLREFPLDALLLNTVVGGLLFGGRQHEMVNVTEVARPAYPERDWFSLGLHAFALQDVERFSEARAAAEAALDAYRPAAFASHALAHVFYETGDDAAGVDFLPGWLDAYDRQAGLHLHLSWHLALFHLSRGEYRRVFELYEHDIRPEVVPIDYQLYDPVSLLWRLELCSCDVERRFWEEVGRIARERATAPGVIFNDLHNGMAFASVGEQGALAASVDSLRARGARGHVTAGEVALPLLQGMAAFAAGDYGEAARLMLPVEDRIFEVGGSHAQHDIFSDTLIEALLRSGRFEEAEVRLRRRLATRPSPRDFYRLGAARQGVGDGVSAASALAEARGRWNALDTDAPEAGRLHGAVETGNGSAA
jgi:tetratricopeptide (TPR) repeat protein